MSFKCHTFGKYTIFLLVIIRSFDVLFQLSISCSILGKNPSTSIMNVMPNEHLIPDESSGYRYGSFTVYLF